MHVLAYLSNQADSDSDFDSDLVNQEPHILIDALL